MARCWEERGEFEGGDLLVLLVLLVRSCSSCCSLVLALAGCFVCQCASVAWLWLWLWPWTAQSQCASDSSNVPGSESVAACACETNSELSSPVLCAATALWCGDSGYASTRATRSDNNSRTHDVFETLPVRV